MDGDRQHIGVVIDNRFRSIPVVYIPIHHGDTFESSHMAQMLHTDRSIRKQTKATAAISFRMVAWWSHERVGRAGCQMPLRHGHFAAVDSCDRTPGARFESNTRSIGLPLHTG